MAALLVFMEISLGDRGSDSLLQARGQELSLKECRKNYISQSASRVTVLQPELSRRRHF